MVEGDSEFWKILWAQVVPATVGVVAFVISNVIKSYLETRQSTKQSKEKAKVWLASHIELITFEVRQLACDYWCMENDGNNRDRIAAAVTGRALFVGELVHELFAASPEVLATANRHVNNFEVECSGGAFGTRKCPVNVEKCRSIEVSAYRLVHFVGSQSRGL